MTLWQQILSDYGDACYFMSFEELADEYDTTEMGIGNAVAAIKRRGALCATFEYADGSEMKLRMRKNVKKKKAQRRPKKKNCGCH